MKLATGIALLFCVHLGAANAWAQGSCSEGSPEDIKRILEATRNIEIIQVRRAVEAIPPANALKGDDRWKFVDRFKEVARAFWDTPEHQKKVAEFMCKKIFAGAIKGQDSYLAAISEMMKESRTERAMWLCATMKKLESEFPEFQTPEGQMALVELYARNERWDYARQSIGKVLETEPNNPAALEWNGAITFNEKTLLDPNVIAEVLVKFRKLVAAESGSAEAHYWVAAIDWTGAFNDLQNKLRDYETKAGKPLSELPGVPVSIQDAFIAKDGAMIDEGITRAQAALKISPNFVEARAYLILLYQLKKEECKTAAERAKYAKLAEELIRSLDGLPSRAPRRGRPEIPPPPPPPPGQEIKGWPEPPKVTT